MAKYQVAVINRPPNWTPECADDVPLELGGPVDVLTHSDDLFDAVSQAMEHNESAEAQQRGRWAVVIEPAGSGRIWPGPSVFADRLQSDRHLVARRLGAQFAVGRAKLRLAGPGCRRRSVVQLSPGGSHRAGSEPAVHGPSRHDVARRRGGRERGRLAVGLLRFGRHGNHGRSPSHARHPARARRPRQLFALSRPRVPVCQGRLVERNANGFGSSQPGLRHGERVSLFQSPLFCAIFRPVFPLNRADFPHSSGISYPNY